MGRQLGSTCKKGLRIRVNKAGDCSGPALKVYACRQRLRQLSAGGRTLQDAPRPIGALGAVARPFYRSSNGSVVYFDGPNCEWRMALKSDKEEDQFSSYLCSAPPVPAGQCGETEPPRSGWKLPDEEPHGVRCWNPAVSCDLQAFPSFGRHMLMRCGLDLARNGASCPRRSSSRG